MEPQTDFSELLGLFNAHGVEYLIVGAYALGRLKDRADLEALGEDEG